MKFLNSILLFTVLHVLIWMSTNWQFVKSASAKNALLLSLFLAVPTSLVAYHACRITYATFDSAWSVRLFGFGISYVVFPIMTWMLLHESPFNLKTGACVILSFAIIAIQIFFPNS